MFKGFLCFLLSCVLMIGCQSHDAPNTIRVGTIAGPETELMEVAQQVAHEKYGLNIKIVQFTDYTMPNAALNEGSINANMFQTIPFFDADCKARNFKLAIIGKTFIYPMALYSKKITNLKQVPNNAIVAIPNDASNETRALLLLQSAGLIKLKKGAGALASPLDIISNPKQLKIKSLDAAQLSRVLPDVTLAAINTNYAVPAGLFPVPNGLFVEGKDSPYANILVVREQDKNDPKYKELLKALQSPEVLAKAKQLFQNQAIPAW